MKPEQKKGGLGDQDHRRPDALDTGADWPSLLDEGSTERQDLSPLQEIRPVG
jgi:hypothetical protein